MSKNETREAVNLRKKKQTERRLAEGWLRVVVWVPTKENSVVIKGMAAHYRKLAKKAAKQAKLNEDARILAQLSKPQKERLSTKAYQAMYATEISERNL